MEILFVCTGNTCRSPMAQALAQNWAKVRGKTDCHVASAGIAAYAGAGASGGACAAMERRGLSLAQHRAQGITRAMLDAADIVLVMGPSHYAALKSLCAEGKLYTLCDYAGADGAVADPFGGDDALYEDCAAQLEALLGSAMERLYEDRA